MVGGIRQRPSLGAVRQALDGVDALAWFLDQPLERQALRDDIDRLEKAAARAGVGTEIAEAKERAMKIIADAQATARLAETEAARVKAQAEEIIAAARRDRTNAEAAAHARKVVLDNRADQLDRREADIKAVEQRNAELAKVLASRETELAHETERLKAWNSRLEAAVRGP